MSLDKDMITICTYADFLLGQKSQGALKGEAAKVASMRKEFSSYENGKERSIARSIGTWSRHLRAQGADRVRLHYLRDGQNIKNLIFVAAGPVWLLEAKKKRRSGLYYNGWGPKNQPDPGKMIRIFYRVGTDVPFGMEYPTNFETIKRRLRKALLENRKFAVKWKDSFFLEMFDNGLRCLEPGSPFGQEKVIPELAPPGHLSADAAQVLACCRASWVFGGQGSWNDYGYNGEKRVEFEKTYTRLLDGIIDAILCSVNQAKT